jgi:predicted  nucleic acid-binding Zn-ribbon protein
VTDEGQSTADKLVERLRQERDELRVRAHLLKAELRDEWDEVEDQWGHFEAKLEHLSKGAKDSTEDIGAAVSVLGEEIARAYKRLRDSLK